MKKIMLISTGGTISAQGISRMDLKDYQSGYYTAKDFLNSLPEINEIAKIDVAQLTNFSSTRIETKHWIMLHNMVEEALNELNYDGVVITHGTNTLEETAYFLHLTVNSRKPVVLVGAQRPFTALGSDAGRNLINGVLVATNSSAIDKGVLVVLNDEINSARDVSKTSTYRLETFQSGNLGFLGTVDPDNTVQFYRTPTRRHTSNSEFSNNKFKELDDVEIVYSYAGSNGDLIRYITNSEKYKGIVIAGTGAGRCSVGEGKALKEAVEKGLMVVRSSRVGNDRVVSIQSFQDFNSITADNLSPQKSRILLMLALSIYKRVSDIQSVFDQY